MQKYIIDEFEGYLRCGIPAYGFGRIKCSTCGAEKIVPFSCTFSIDVLACETCCGRMNLVEVIYDSPTITKTLKSLEIRARAPPLAPAKVRQETLFDYIEAT